MPDPSFEELVVAHGSACHDMGYHGAKDCNHDDGGVGAKAFEAVKDYEFDLQEKLKMAKSLLEMMVEKHARLREAVESWELCQCYPETEEQCPFCAALEANSPNA